MVIPTMVVHGHLLPYIDVLSALQGSSLLFLQIVPIPLVHTLYCIQLQLQLICAYVQHLRAEECLD